MTIRQATHHDRLALVAMALRFLEDPPYAALLAQSPEHLEGLVRAVLKDGAVFVADVDGVLVGMVAIVVVPHPASGELYADELVWWVDPAHRAGRIGPALLAGAEAWAKGRGAVFMKLSAPAESRVGGWLERRGYQPIEMAFAKRLSLQA